MVEKKFIDSLLMSGERWHCLKEQHEPSVKPLPSAMDMQE